MRSASKLSSKDLASSASINIRKSIDVKSTPKSVDITESGHISGDEETTRVLTALRNTQVVPTVAPSSDSESDSDRATTTSASKRKSKRKTKQSETKNTTSITSKVEYEALQQESNRLRSRVQEVTKQLDSTIKVFGTREGTLKRQRDEALDEVNRLQNKVRYVFFYCVTVISTVVYLF
jgi:hypothetical protein